MMVAIKFKKEFYSPILRGVKTQTLRRPSGRIDVVPGDFASCVFEDCPETIFITITDVGYKLWSKLNDGDAKHEGFENVHELKMALIKIYPNIEPWDRFYYYRFKVEGNTERVGE